MVSASDGPLPTSHWSRFQILSLKCPKTFSIIYQCGSNWIDIESTLTWKDNNKNMILYSIFIHLSITNWKYLNLFLNDEADILNKIFSSILVCMLFRPPTRTFSDIEKKKSSSSFTQKVLIETLFYMESWSKCPLLKSHIKTLKYFFLDKNISYLK